MLYTRIPSWIRSTTVIKPARQSLRLRASGGFMFRSITALTLLLGAAPFAGAQTQRVSAPITDVSYEITADSAAVGRRQLGVSMSFHVASNAPVILSLPAWS